MSKLKGKVAVVTGASKGIGAAIAKALAAEGASVVVNYASSKAGADTVVAAITKAGGKAVAVGGDVSKAAEAQGIIDAAIKNYGRLDILCNNAGIMDLMTPAADVPLALWDRVLAVNLTGPFLACRRAIPLMLQQGGGSIVNTASEAGLRGGAAGTAYTVSKHGVVGLTKSIAFHYGDQGIRCNAVCPGSVETAIGLGGGSPHQAGLAKVMPLLQHTPAARIARPEHIASVIAFLASLEASNVNGAILPADYGWSAV